MAAAAVGGTGGRLGCVGTRLQQVGGEARGAVAVKERERRRERRRRHAEERRLRDDGAPPRLAAADELDEVRREEEVRERRVRVVRLFDRAEEGRADDAPVMGIWGVRYGVGDVGSRDAHERGSADDAAGEWCVRSDVGGCGCAGDAQGDAIDHGDRGW